MENNVHIAGRRAVYDAIVIGSGITGGWAAKELAEQGLKTLLLERGRHVDHPRDYVLEALRRWRPSERKKDHEALFEEEYYIQQRCEAFDETTRPFFINDKAQRRSRPAALQTGCPGRLSGRLPRHPEPCRLQS